MWLEYVYFNATYMFSNMNNFELITVLPLGKSSYRDETFWYILGKSRRF